MRLTNLNTIFASVSYPHTSRYKWVSVLSGTEMRADSLVGVLAGRQRLLLIDDDSELAGLLQEFLAEQGISLEVCSDGETGLRKAFDGRFDLILLDIMMPRLDGFIVLDRLRQRSDVPVLMLTAVADQASRIAGLQGGADDYLLKPFDPVELLARVRAILRRTKPRTAAAPRAFKVCGILLDTGTRTVLNRRELVEVTTAEFDILQVLIQNVGHVVPRDEITQALYQREATPFDRWIDVHISHLRKKLENAGAVIRTIRGVGYLLAPEKPEEG